MEVPARKKWRLARGGGNGDPGGKETEASERRVDGMNIPARKKRRLASFDLESSGGRW